MRLSIEQNPTLLFAEWKLRKDRVAGQLLAQTVADWYYALATSFAGEELGAEIAESACSAFGQQVVKLSAEDDLIPWAHALIEKKLRDSGTRATGLNRPSLYSNARPPVDVLLYAKKNLPEEVALLEAAYRGEMPAHQLASQTKELGYPYALLLARYAVKKILRDDLKAPLAIIYDDPDRDLCPLPLYESGRLQDNKERSTFEQWVITRNGISQDIAEFAPFAIELRQGLPNRPPPISMTPVISPVRSMSLGLEPNPAPQRSSRTPTHPPFMFERPTGRPAPEHHSRRPNRVPRTTGSSLRVRVSMGLIIFSLALAFGLMLTN